MPREKVWESDAERMRAKRAEQKAADTLADERHEQEVRDRFGYASSETRTERERSDTAARILGRDP